MIRDRKTLAVVLVVLWCALLPAGVGAAESEDFFAGEITGISGITIEIPDVMPEAPQHDFNGPPGDSVVQSLPEEEGTIVTLEDTEFQHGGAPEGPGDVAQPRQNYFFIIFMDNYRILYESKVLEQGAAIECPAFVPGRDGHSFAYWYDSELYAGEGQDPPEPYVFPGVAEKDLKLLAYFDLGPEDQEELEEGQRERGPQVYHEPSITIFALHHLPLLEGDDVMLWANLSGFDGMDLRLQWQRSTDNAYWEDIPGGNGYNYVFTATPENIQYEMRLAVKATSGS